MIFRRRGLLQRSPWDRRWARRRRGIRSGGFVADVEIVTG